MKRPVKLQLIVAMTQDRVIGQPNALPWHIPEDLKRFKRMTIGQTVIMGLNTYRSIGRPLPKRHNIVLDKEGRLIAGVTVCRSIPSAIKRAYATGQQIFVIGGASVYEQLLPQVEIMHISQVKKDYAGSIYFPEYDRQAWRETASEEFREFTAKTYERIPEK